MKNKQQTGFTIVELLIVIVIIGILAAITIVAYNGIQQRARVASLMSDLTNAADQLKIDQTLNSNYPTSLAAANNGQGIPASSGTTYQYSYDNTTSPQSFCITATNGTTSYYIDQDGSPMSGACAGQANGGATLITNLSTNPSYETDYIGAGAVGGSTVSRTSTKAEFGTHSVQITLGTGSQSLVGFFIGAYGSTAVPDTFKPNTTYVTSVYVYIPSGTVDMYVSIQGSGVATNQNQSASATTSVKDGWVRLTNQFTTNASGSINMYVINKQTISTSGTLIWADGVMITEGSSIYTYADGSSPGWKWNGTVNDSTSVGSAL